MLAIEKSPTPTGPETLHFVLPRARASRSFVTPDQVAFQQLLLLSNWTGYGLRTRSRRIGRRLDFREEVRQGLLVELGEPGQVDRIKAALAQLTLGDE